MQLEDVCSIALDLAPLVAQYRSQGRLSLRVERMQQHARFSRGRNNGDRTWSLMCDELDGLQYLVREDSFEAHSLSVRVIDIEQQGATLAVLDVPVSLNGKAVAPDIATSSRETKNLKSEVERLRSELAAREDEFAKRTAELAGAQESASAQLQEQLAAANEHAAIALEEKRMQWQFERDALIAGSEEAEAALADANASAAQMEQALRAEINMLNDAIAKRQHEEFARIAAAEKAWKAQTDRATAELVQRCERAETDRVNALHQGASNAALVEQKLRDELSLAVKSLQDREAALADAHVQIARYASDAAQHDRTRAELSAARVALAERPSTVPAAPPTAGGVSASDMAEIEQRVRREAAELLAKAQAEWAKSEAIKLAEAEAQFLARSEAAVREAKAHAREEAQETLLQLRKEFADSVRSRSGASEIEQLYDQIITLQADLAGRDSELARLNQIIRESELYGAGHRPHEAEDDEGSSRSTGRFIRDLVVVATLVIVPIILFPYVEPMLPYKWQYEIESTMPQLAPSSSAQADQLTAREPAPKMAATSTIPPALEATVARAARLHAGPKTSSATLSVVSSGTGVSVIRTSGNWSMVQAGNEQGWIYDTYLRGMPQTKTGE